MRLVILDDYDKASEWAAKYIKKRINNFKPGPDKYFTLGLPTGQQFCLPIPPTAPSILLTVSPNSSLTA